MNRQKIGIHLLLALRIPSGPELCNASWIYPKRKRYTIHDILVHSMQNQVCYLFMYLESPIGMFLFKLKKITNIEFNQYMIDKLIYQYKTYLQ